MVEIGIHCEAGASVAGAGAVVQDQPVALGASGTVGAAIHIDDDAPDRVGDHPPEAARVEEELLGGDRVASDDGRPFHGTRLAGDQLHRNGDEHLGLDRLGSHSAQPGAEQIRTDLVAGAVFTS